MSKVIVFDIDDTCGDFSGDSLPIFNRHFGTNLLMEEWITPQLRVLFPCTHPDEAGDVIVANGILENLTILPGVKETIDKVVELGFIPVFCTSRAFHPTAHHITCAWLDNSALPYRHVIVTDHGESKVEALNKHYKGEIKLFVDDNADHVADAALNGLAEHVVLVTKPWNAHSTHDKRITHLAEILDLLQ